MAPLEEVSLDAYFLCIFVGHSCAYVSHFVLRDVWMQILRAGVASRRTTDICSTVLYSHLLT
jgi:hypothetical protein